MPPVFIDLLSSPILAPLDLPSHQNRQVTVSNSTRPPNARIQDNDGYLLLSDDDLSGNGDVLPARDARTSPGMATVTAAEVIPRLPVKGDNDFFFLSDDFDSTVNFDDSTPAHAIARPTGTARCAERRTPSQSANREEPSNLFLPVSNPRSTANGSDIFKAKTYIDPFLSDSEVELLPAKTRGSSASPKKAAPTRTLKRASTGLGKESMARGSDLRAKRAKVVSDLDPIVFTSSPDNFGLLPRPSAARGHTIRGDNIMSRSVIEGVRSSKGRADVNDPVEVDILSSDIELPDVGAIAALPPIKASKRPTDKAAGKVPAEKKIRVKAQNDREKLLAKEAEQERKRLQKEEKAREKAKGVEFAGVNKLRTDKKVSTPEMIVDLPTTLDDKLATQVRNFLAPLQVQHTEWTSPVDNVIKWRRKVVAVYNEDMGHWEPVPPTVEADNHVMCVMHAKDFVNLVTADEGQDLDSHVLKMKARFEGKAIIYLIEGLTPWMRKNKNIKNRKFVAAIRQQIDDEMGQAAPTASQASRRKKAPPKPPPEYVDEDMIEDALLRMQVIHTILLHHTGAPIETAEWVVAFTQHISTIPYRSQRLTLDASFCMETGQVKTGEGPADTFVKMLQEIARITAPVAYGIAARYDSVASLRKGLEKEGPLALQALRKSANRDGAFTDREVGQAVSRRVYKIFMGLDPASTEV